MAALAKADRSSTITPPAKARPCGPRTAKAAATSRASTARPLNTTPPLPRKAPSTSRVIAETARMTSGQTSERDARVIGGSPGHSGAPGADQRLDGGAGDVEDDVGLEAQVQG